MHPELFKIGAFPVRSYGVLLMIGVLVAVWMSRRRAPRFGVEPDRFYDAVFWMVIPGILGARITYMALNWGYYAANPAELWSFQFNGLTSFGGMIGGFIGFIVWARIARQPIWPMLDAMAVPVLVAHAFGRIGCLLNGCCFGWPSTLPIAVPVDGHAGTFLPAQAFDTLMCLAFAAALAAYDRRRLPIGMPFSIAVVAYGVSRFIYEFWRAGPQKNGVYVQDLLFSLPITKGQGMALVLVVVGILMVLKARQRPMHSEAAAA